MCISDVGLYLKQKGFFKFNISNMLLTFDYYYCTVNTQQPNVPHNWSLTRLCVSKLHHSGRSAVISWTPETTAEQCCIVSINSLPHVHVPSQSNFSLAWTWLVFVIIYTYNYHEIYVVLQLIFTAFILILHRLFLH